MTVQYVNAFVKAVKTVFLSMLDMEVTFNNPIPKNRRHPSFDISSVIKITADRNHWIVFSYSQEMAMDVASKILNESFTEINDDLVDAIGEIANMVVGVVDTELETDNVTYSLPTVVVSRDKITYPENGFIFSMPCFMKTGTFEVDIALLESPTCQAEKEKTKYGT